MRLVSIEVDGLFGMFDHRLPLSDERVSIVIAPNGYGKSRMLSIVHSMMALDLSTLLETDFAQARLTMDDGSWLTAFRECPSTGARIRLEFGRQGVEGSFDTAPLLADMDESDRKLRDVVKDLVRLDEGGQVPEYLDRKGGRELSFVQALLLYKDLLDDGIEGRLPPKALVELTDSMPVVRVSTQRTLQHECACPMEGEPGFLYPYIFTPTVRDISDEVSRTVRTARHEGDRLLEEIGIDDAAALWQSMVAGKDMVLKGGRFDGRVRDIENRVRRLEGLGLLTTPLFDIPASTSMIEERGVIAMETYLDRYESSIDETDDLVLRLERLLGTINSMLLFKRIWIDDSGFRVRMENGRILSVEDLSAGEQQLLIMMYSLIFRTLPGSVAIIDEPEISLHVAWQQRMVPAILDIADMMDIQVILATHSPQIVHDRWDLTVQLGG